MSLADMQSDIYGRYGESIAKNYLIDNGFNIEETNYHSKYGEIDIIAKKDNRTHFVEVKARRTNKRGFGRESIDTKKLHRILVTANYYLLENKLQDSAISFDCIEISDNEITFLPNIL